MPLKTWKTPIPLFTSHRQFRRVYLQPTNTTVIPSQRRSTAGEKTWEGDEIGGADDDLTKYVLKYGTKFFPNAPVELDGRNKTLALQSAISQLGLRNPVASQPLYGTNNMGTNWDTRDFVLVNSFKTTGDRVENGINTAATSAPIEIDLSFAQATQNKQLITFVEQANTLYIKNDGISSMVKG